MKISNIDYEIGIYDLEGHFIDITDSWEVLEKDFGIFKNDIYAYIPGCNNTIRKFQIRLKNKIYLSGLPSKIGDISHLCGHVNPKKPVAKYYKNKLIAVYDSVTQASELNGLERGSISNSCIKNCRASIYHFKYIE